MDCYIVRYAEIGLKGNNRCIFEEKLLRNIVECLKRNNKKYNSVKRVRGRILIYSRDDLSCLRCVFGVSSFSPCFEIEQDMDQIKEVALNLICDETCFAIHANRPDKSFKINSMDIQKEVGAYVVAHKDIKVNLNNPEIKINIEILQGKAYVYSSLIKGPGGLPVGSAGKVLSLINDNVLASLLAMKRGCDVYPVVFEKKPLGLLEKYGNYNSFIKIKDISEVEDIAAKKKIDVLVVDQNIDNLNEINCSLVVLSPLVGFDLKTIKEKICFYENL